MASRLPNLRIRQRNLLHELQHLLARSSMTLNTGSPNATRQGYTYPDLAPLLDYTVTVTNTGSIASVYFAILSANTANAGPAPFPNKWVVEFDRYSSMGPGESASLMMEVSIGSMARYDESGHVVLYPEIYELALNNERDAVLGVIVDGEEMVIKEWPKDEQGVGLS